MVVTFYIVAINDDFVNTENPRGNRGLGSCKLLVTTLSFTNHYITLFYVCLFKDASFNIYH